MSEPQADTNTASNAFGNKDGAEFFKLESNQSEHAEESPSVEAEATPSAEAVENSEQDTSTTDGRYDAKAYKKLQAEFTRVSQKAKELEDKVALIQEQMPKVEEPKIDKQKLIDRFFEDPEGAIAEIAVKAVKPMVVPIAQRSKEAEIQRACDDFESLHEDVRELQEEMIPLTRELLDKGFSIEKALELSYKAAKADKLPEMVSNAKKAKTELREASVRNAHTEKAGTSSRNRNNGDDEIPPELKEMMTIRTSRGKKIF